MEIIICDDNLLERSLMIGYILKWASEKHLEIRINACKDWMELIATLRGKEWNIVIVSLDSMRDLDTTSNMQLFSRRLVRISDLNFGVQTHRMCVSYFFMKPVSRQKMQRVLECALKGQDTTWYPEECKVKQRQHTGVYKRTRKQPEQENCALQTLAELDGLTGLCNRITMERRVNNHLRRKRPGAMIVLDLGHFKQVNDCYGHIAGDVLLCTTANVLKGIFSGCNLVGYVGEDELVIFIPSTLDDPMTAGECLRIQERSREVWLGSSTLIKPSITINSTDSRACTKHRGVFDCADQKIVAKKRLRNLKDDASLIPPSGEPAGIQPDMSLIAMEVEEKETQPGAHCQDYETFKQVYRLEERRSRRDKKGAFIILLTLTDKNSGFPPLDKGDTEMDILGEKIKQSLRMEDVYTRYGSCRYPVMMLGVFIESVGAIVDHTCSAYYQMYREAADNLILHYGYPLRPARGRPRAPRPQ